MRLDAIEVVTLFVEDIDASKAFYQKVFNPEVLGEDEGSALLKFSGAMINLLRASQAPELVTPSPVGAADSGPRMLFTVRVDDVDAAYAELRDKGVTFLNGPINRPWGRRTATFADPAGHAWELAQPIT